MLVFRSLLWLCLNEFKARWKCSCQKFNFIQLTTLLGKTMKHAARTALLSNLKWNINCQQERVRITFAKISKRRRKPRP